MLLDLVFFVCVRKTNLVLFFGPQLNQNLKTVTQNLSRLHLTLKDRNVIIFDKMPPTLLQKTKEYLERLKLGKPSNYTTTHFENFQSFVEGSQLDGNQIKLISIHHIDNQGF